MVIGCWRQYLKFVSSIYHPWVSPALIHLGLDVLAGQ